jgi:hypothetical protein
MKEITVNSKDNNTHLLSDEDYDKCLAYKWYTNKTGYACARIDGKLMLMHHFIIGKPDIGMVVDHINGKVYDNRRENLRMATISENNQNVRRKNKGNYIGIYYNDIKKSWRAYCNGMYLGSYKDEIEAAKQYDKAAYTLFGPHAKTNNLISYSEVEGKYEIDDLKFKSNRKLPKNITYRTHTKYGVKIEFEGKKYEQTGIKTLEEAEKILDEFKQKIDIIKQDRIKQHFEIPIERDANGIAIIKCKDNDILVDDDKWHELSLMYWFMTSGYVKTKKDNTTIFMHRMILDAEPNTIVDHINHNRLDNRISNLRIVEPNINAHNKSKRKNLTSVYIGVCKNKNRWEANVRFQGKKYYCGVYSNELEAAKAYNLKAKELYGDYANLNEV